MNEFFIGIALPAKILIWFYVILTPITIVLAGILKAIR